VLVEQAIFTSAVTDRAQGYQLTSRSPGISDADARELALWGPSHDSLLEGHGATGSVNFNRLSSGAFAISRTTTGGAEYSGRGGAQVYTQFLVVSPELFARFANNPFAVLRAATATGAVVVHSEIPTTLEPFRLLGRSAAVEPGVLAQVSHRPGPAAMATLVQAALSSDQLAVATATNTESLFAGLINALPVECRADFSFSTGLKYSPSRPVRVGALPSDPSAWRAIARHGVTLLNLDATDAAADVCWEGWAGCIAKILDSGRLSFLATELDRPRPWLSCANLSSFAEQFRTMLEPPTVAFPAGTPAEAACEVESGETSGVNQRADAPHTHLGRAAQTDPSASATAVADDLSVVLAGQPPEVVELLERIDDLVFAAISGDAHALGELEVLWPTVAADLDDQLVEQSREQYLRCALSIWGECVASDGKRPERAVSAIDVLCVLFEQ